MGAPEQPHLTEELTHSFCRADPAVASHFARVTFMSDLRAEMACLQAPTLILQCSDDLIVPVSVGTYLSQTIPNATLRLIDNVGHLPHLSSPSACAEAMREFLPTLEQSTHAD